MVKETSPTGKNLQVWEFLHPEGSRISESVTLNPHPATLENKTVVLTWNNKPNGDVFLNRLAELLVKDAKVGKVIKLWEQKPFTSRVSQSPDVSKQIANAVKEYRSDLVINSQGD